MSTIKKIVKIAFATNNFFTPCLLLIRFFIHDEVIICAYVTTPFDKLRVTGHGEPVEPCGLSCFSNDRHAQLFMTLCIVLPTEALQIPQLQFVNRKLFDLSSSTTPPLNKDYVLIKQIICQIEIFTAGCTCLLEFIQIHLLLSARGK